MIGDFMERATVVTYGGRRFVCRRPTVAAVLRALDLFADYIAAGATIEADVDTIELMAQMAHQQPERSGHVLECCVDGGVGEIRSACLGNSELASALVRGVLSITNLERIIGELDLTKLDNAAAVEAASHDGPTDIELNVVEVAQLFRQTPEAVMAWPFEQFVGVLECLRHEQQGAPDEFATLTQRYAEQHAKA